MTFGIAQYTNLTIKQNSWVNDLSNELKLFFEKRTYGKDLNELYFGLITVKPEFDQFHKKRRPRYRPGERTSTVDGITIKSNNFVEIDVKIDYSEVSRLEKRQLLERVCKEILIECDCLTKFSKLKDFNYEQFRSDFESYLIEQAYIKR
ncbi:MAG: hypothetical protein ACO1OF_20390 [Adhaeribacter sp.]